LLHIHLGKTVSVDQQYIRHAHKQNVQDEGIIEFNASLEFLRNKVNGDQTSISDADTGAQGNGDYEQKPARFIRPWNRRIDDKTRENLG
jgi:hypothetical protein